ncbi:hypothetical protein HMPREF9446_00479 [Bacteroides fluxus YIT 12057]|uniref:Uncharacterized protein n=1 Tax=Bacteroides fluxus YIT 12057 TaxID=763034 RepID=F3PP39_9BACE|nr:hypothetical protein HMPREF9446_00479 [Bacteroides fluxus YIT 12057]
MLISVQISLFCHKGEFHITEIRLRITVPFFHIYTEFVSYFMEDGADTDTVPVSF